MKTKQTKRQVALGEVRRNLNKKRFSLKHIVKTQFRVASALASLGLLYKVAAMQAAANAREYALRERCAALNKQLAERAEVINRLESSVEVLEQAARSHLAQVTLEHDPQYEAAQCFSRQVNVVRLTAIVDGYAVRGHVGFTNAMIIDPAAAEYIRSHFVERIMRAIKHAATLT